MMTGIQMKKRVFVLAVCTAMGAPVAVEAQSAWQMGVGTGGGMAPSTRLGEDAALHAGVHLFREGGGRFFGVDFARAELELGPVDAISLSGARYLNADPHRRYYLAGGLDLVRLGMDHLTPVLGLGARLETLRMPIYSEVRVRLLDDLGRESALSILAGVIW